MQTILDHLTVEQSERLGVDDEADTVFQFL